MIYQDNLGTISGIDGVKGLRKLKHIGFKYHFVRSMTENICQDYEHEYTEEHGIIND